MKGGNKEGNRRDQLKKTDGIGPLYLDAIRKLSGNIGIYMSRVFFGGGGITVNMATNWGYQGKRCSEAVYNFLKLHSKPGHPWKSPKPDQLPKSEEIRRTLTWAISVKIEYPRSRHEYITGFQNN